MVGSGERMGKIGSKMADDQVSFIPVVDYSPKRAGTRDMKWALIETTERKWKKIRRPKEKTHFSILQDFFLCTFSACHRLSARAVSASPDGHLPGIVHSVTSF